MGCSNTVNYVIAHPERILSFALIAGGIGDIVPMARAMMAADPPTRRRASEHHAVRRHRRGDARR